jgi:hypothetical protein
MVPLLYCLRRGLGLKDGPGSAKVVRCQCLAEVVGFILSPSARTGPSGLGPAGEGRSDGGMLHLHPRDQARYPGGGRRREDEPPGEGWRVRANTQDDEHQGDKCNFIGQERDEQVNGIGRAPSAPWNKAITRGFRPSR